MAIRLNKFIGYILDLLFPPRCIFCNHIMSPGTILEVCGNCRQRLPFVRGKVCNVCGQPIGTHYGVECCSDCRNEPHYFVQGASALEYRGLVRKAVIRYKFRGKRRYAKTLGILISDRIKQMTNWPIFDMIVYTPLYKRKQASRGFNQAALLAGTIAEQLHIALGREVLIKIKDTLPQSALDRSKRKQNIRNAIRIDCNCMIAGMNVLLIDDVYTTGTTVDECCRVLMKAGAKAVYIATAAIGKGYD